MPTTSNPEHLKKEVQCADCQTWFEWDKSHTCKRQVRQNQRVAKRRQAMKSINDFWNSAIRAAKQRRVEWQVNMRALDTLVGSDKQLLMRVAEHGSRVGNPAPRKTFDIDGILGWWANSRLLVPLA